MNIRIIAIASLLIALPVSAQKKKTVVNDSNTPLHLLQPAYQGTYGDLTPEQVKREVDRVFAYIDKETPARVVDKNTGKVITDYATMGEEAQLERGAFRLASYEWGVTYSALIAASEATGNTCYMDYVQNRFRFLAEVAPHFKRVYKEKGTTDPQLLQILTPHALDDAGAVCAAMVKVRLKDPSLPVDELIRNYFDFIINKEYRLADGTFARNRPQHNTLWLDDMFMITAIQAQAYRVTNERKYIDRAAREMVLYLDSIQQPSGLFYHAPTARFCWGRGNGWMAVGMAELLRILPEDNPDRKAIMQGYLKMMVRLKEMQDQKGMWKQVVDDASMWEETSGTGMFAYAMIVGVKKGWLDKDEYGPAARKAWIALTSYVNQMGDVEGVCEGTMLGNTSEHYRNRKPLTGDLHGQAPALWCAYALIAEKI